MVDKNRQKILVSLPNLFVFVEGVGGLADTNYSWDDDFYWGRILQRAGTVRVGTSVPILSKLLEQALSDTPITDPNRGSSSHSTSWESAKD